MEKVSLAAAFDSFEEQWAPRTAGAVNDHALKLAKVEGEFVTHHHEADELFLVRSGEVRIEFTEAADVTLGPGELLVVPAGVEHRPVAEAEAELLLFERADTKNTGSAGGERTREPTVIED